MNTRKAFIEEITQQLEDGLPPGLGLMRDDIQSIVKTAMTGTLSRLELVTREEFDVQTAVLLRSREKLEALALRLEQLEEKS